jgi:hypothetical protein
MEVAVEAKGVERVRRDHLKGLRSIVHDHANIKQRILVCCVPTSYQTDDGILVLNYGDFIDRLWRREIIN